MGQREGWGATAANKTAGIASKPQTIAIAARIRREVKSMEKNLQLDVGQNRIGITVYPL